MQHHEPECHAEKIVCYVHCQGHCEGWYDQNMTLSIIRSKLLIIQQPNFIWLYIIISQSVPYEKNGITALKVKVTAKCPNVSVGPYDIF